MADIPVLEKYVSINLTADDERGVHWLVMLFPDETVVRLPLDATELQQLKLAAACGEGTVKVKVGNG